MKPKFKVSDFVTSSRILFVALFVITLIFSKTFFGLIFGAILILVIFLTDSLDGYIARRLKEASKLGAFYDIVGDRIAETALLIPFVYFGIASPLILIYYVLKNFLVDYHRFTEFIVTSDVPFDQVKNKLGKFLLKSGYMRSSYVILKIAMVELFYFVIFITDDRLRLASVIVGWLTVIISILRTLPSFLTKFNARSK